VQECLERIDRATSNMDSLINDILSITKIEAGHMEMDSKVESLSDVAEEVIDMLSPLSSQADLRVTLHQNAERTEIKCDRSRIIQVLSNVLGNAIKFTLPGGKIDIALTNPSRDTITISIKDTGPGIPPANLRNIFDRFWQAQQTRRLGTGLGLAIAKGVVEHHGGAIWAESDGKSGTIFHVNFPLVAIIV
jgi:signal transduction histidine kinase